MTTGKPIGVLLVDDHAVVREGLKMVLARDPQIKVVGTAMRARSSCGIVGNPSVRNRRPAALALGLRAS